MRKLLCIISLLVSFTASAAVDCVVVVEKSGAKNIIPLVDASEITFGDQIMSVGSLDFELVNLVRYEFADSSNVGIEEITGDIRGFKIDPKGYITIPENVMTSHIEVVKVNGTICDYAMNGNILDIHELPEDVYVIKIGNSSFKLMKR